MRPVGGPQMQDHLPSYGYRPRDNHMPCSSKRHLRPRKAHSHIADRGVNVHLAHLHASQAGSNASVLTWQYDGLTCDEMRRLLSPACAPGQVSTATTCPLQGLLEYTVKTVTQQCKQLSRYLSPAIPRRVAIYGRDSTSSPQTRDASSMQGCCCWREHPPLMSN